MRETWVSGSENRRVLVVDDDDDIADSLRDVLGDEGYDVTIARDGLQAIDMLRTSGKPALVLLDWMMPRCDGGEFRRRQLADPNLAQIPVVLLSADARIQSRGERLGIREALNKPVRLPELLETVGRYFAR